MARLTRYFLKLAYDGTNYHGWQVQPNNSSVQEVLNRCMSTMLNQEVATTGCGRTDTGVHASEFYAHFEIEGKLPGEFIYKINSMLPDDIVVFEVEDRGRLHARYDATLRTYQYYLHFSKDVFLHRYSCYYPYYELDFEKMKEVAAVIPGYKEFKPLCRYGKQYTNSLCDVTESYWEQLNDNQIRYTISANRFLRSMVRRVVGACVMVGKGSLSLDRIAEVMAEQSEFRVKLAAPPQGLYLTKIDYGEIGKTAKARM